ncbi:MAG: hypothetical protein IT290_05930 [Deltaproteobacteria bacterium]|nr:hypothetical protein [Deltaproteobacteria bacterium]
MRLIHVVTILISLSAIGCGGSSDDSGSLLSRPLERPTPGPSPFPTPATNSTVAPSPTPEPLPADASAIELGSFGETELSLTAGPYELNTSIGAPIVIGRSTSSGGSAIMVGTVGVPE